MRRYIVLLLITGIVWAQTDFDKLVLRDGTTYFGEYSKIEGDRVYFWNHAIPSLPAQSVPVKLIETIELKDGQFIILNGKDILAYEEYQKDSLEEYQKLSTKEKAIYDAKSQDLGKWALFGPMSTILFVGCVFSYMGLTNDLSTPSPFILGSSLAASLTIPYFVLYEKFNFPKSILNITDSEKEIYKQAYSKELQKRKFIYAAVSTIVTGITFAVVVGPPSLSSSSSGGTTGKGFTGFGP
jgi:hypothetical protein